MCKEYTTTRICLYCGSTFQARIYSHQPSARYCSRSCGTRAQTPDPIKLFWSKVNKTNTCWLWTGTQNGNRYGVTSLGTNRTGKIELAHRTSYEFTFGSIPEGMIVRHTCDTPLCVNPDHLCLGTQLDNIEDRDRRHRTARGEKIASAKLTEQDVLNIRALHAIENYKVCEIAKLYSLSPGTVSSIIRRQRWKHI